MGLEFRVSGVWGLQGLGVWSLGCLRFKDAQGLKVERISGFEFGGLGGLGVWVFGASWFSDPCQSTKEPCY